MKNASPAPPGYTYTAAGGAAPVPNNAARATGQRPDRAYWYARNVAPFPHAATRPAMAADPRGAAAYAAWEKELATGGPV